ncbi:ECF transporter S component [Anaerosporobacter sp.]|uniref:ECF transporter S component n=1 Tax=Anaerosporobacter sp. TaxID=1872529 RepID=UPI00286EC093|nr:ECF transporter S component [Anaerosporobacter sp.]
MNGKQTTLKLAQAALMAALCYIGFQFLRFDIPIGMEKTAIHFGNTFCVLGALLLGGVWGGLAGAVGMTIADLTSDYVTYAPKTFLLKLCIGLIVGLVAHKIAKLSQEHNKSYVMRWTVISAVSGMVFNIVADPVVGYFYKKYLLGMEADLAKTLAKITALATVVNALTSVVIASLLYAALRPALIKSDLYVRIGREKQAKSNIAR